MFSQTNCWLAVNYTICWVARKSYTDGSGSQLACLSRPKLWREHWSYTWDCGWLPHSGRIIWDWPIPFPLRRNSPLNYHRMFTKNDFDIESWDLFTGSYFAAQLINVYANAKEYNYSTYTTSFSHKHVLKLAGVWLQVAGLTRQPTHGQPFWLTSQETNHYELRNIAHHIQSKH